jgi:hypothetical protein
MGKSDDALAVEPEDKERVNQIARDIIAPGLHKVVQEAQSQAPIHEVLSAMVNAYGAVLLEMIDRKAAASLLRSYADHLDQNNSKNSE